MAKKGRNVRVLTQANELEFTIKPKTSGQELFDQIIQTTGIREKWYFGLQYTNSHGDKCWLRLERRVSDQDIKKESILQFQFKVKFYPEVCEDEVIQASTLHLFYLQVRQDILREDCYCPPEKAVLLASFASQIKHGNYDSMEHQTGYLANDKILPESVITGHKLTREEWENKISMFHAKHSGMSKEEAMMEYMKVAQDLETYGISYFDIVNKKKTEVLLGVDALGINIYEKANRLNPTVSFPWSEIRKIQYTKPNKVVLILTDKSSGKITVSCTKPKMNKEIYNLATGNHEMYKRRRMPDTLEVQQMKSQKRDEDEARAKEKALLSREMLARQKAEKRRLEMEAKYKEMEEKMKRKEEELQEKDEKIKELEEQLRQLREAKENLETQQSELKEMMEKLEEAKNLELAERERMEEEIRAKQEEIDKVREEVEEKERRAQELQEEVELSRQKYEESQLVTNTDAASEVSESVSESSSEEKESKVDEIPEIVVDPVEEGREVGLDDATAGEIEDLGKELDELRDVEQENTEDRLYRENLRLTGRDKYKTLREVRKGNTKRRIDVFENM